MSVRLFDFTRALTFTCIHTFSLSFGPVLRGITTFLHVIVTDQTPSMWLPAGVYLLALTPMGARCNTLEFDEGNRREESDVRQSFLASYQFFSVRVCVFRGFCLL